MIRNSDKDLYVKIFTDELFIVAKLWKNWMVYNREMATQIILYWNVSTRNKVYRGMATWKTMLTVSVHCRLRWASFLSPDAPFLTENGVLTVFLFSLTCCIPWKE